MSVFWRLPQPKWDKKGCFLCVCANATQAGHGHIAYNVHDSNNWEGNENNRKTSKSYSIAQLWSSGYVYTFEFRHSNFDMGLSGVMPMGAAQPAFSWAEKLRADVHRMFWSAEKSFLHPDRISHHRPSNLKKCNFAENIEFRDCSTYRPTGQKKNIDCVKKLWSTL